jgi:hypothetical protein
LGSKPSSFKLRFSRYPTIYPTIYHTKLRLYFDIIVHGIISSELKDEELRK